MATAKKLPSGSYRCRVYAGKKDGKNIYKSFTAPTKKEAELLSLSYLNDIESENDKDSSSDTIGNIVSRYIKSKEKILSQTTLCGYLSVQKNLMSEIQHKNKRA